MQRNAFTAGVLFNIDFPCATSGGPMKTLYIATAVMALLTACGGGQGSGPNGQVLAAPTPPAWATNKTVDVFVQADNTQDTIVAFIGAADLTISGRLNKVWLSAAQAGGKVLVSGDLNTLVLMPGGGTRITVTGASNTFYLPLGSPNTVEGSGLAFSTIRYFTP
jgi:hypothetical protein